MLTPLASHQSPVETPAPSPADAQNDTPAANPIDSPAHTPKAYTSFASTPTTPPNPPAADTPTPAPTTEATPSIQLLQLRNQLQQVEGQHLQLIEETKVSQTSLNNFLCFQFPNVANFFPTQPTTAPPPAAASTADPSVEADQMEPINLSMEDVFNWQTPHEHLLEVLADIPESYRARKCKAPVAKIIKEDTPTDTTVDLEATSDPPTQLTPTRRQRLNIIINDSSDDENDDGNNNGSADLASSRSVAF
ncbi:hypothetical protein V6N13_098759 [Hibiscus sabdariffa]